MDVPGFAAEASLYHSGHMYGGQSKADYAAPSVVPRFRAGRPAG